MNPFIRWPEAITRCEAQSIPYVFATVIGREGSVPREPGSKMIVTAEHTFDTLGGGELEFMLTKKAREHLLTGKPDQILEKIPLAAAAGQCCGGSVSILLEVFCPSRPLLAVFGAGHVACALMTILSQLPIPVRWIDNRDDIVAQALPEAGNIQRCFGADAVKELKALPAGAQILILTHNHQLDYELLSAALKRADLSWIGCIGSANKQQRFFRRLHHDGFTEQETGLIHMPVGHADVGGKLPMEVAVSISAQLLSLNSTQPSLQRSGIDWREMRQHLNTEPVITSQE